MLITFICLLWTQLMCYSFKMPLCKVCYPFNCVMDYFVTLPFIIHAFLPLCLCLYCSFHLDFFFFLISLSLCSNIDLGGNYMGIYTHKSPSSYIYIKYIYTHINLFFLFFIFFNFFGHAALLVGS